MKMMKRHHILKRHPDGLELVPTKIKEVLKFSGKKIYGVARSLGGCPDLSFYPNNKLAMDHTCI